MAEIVLTYTVKVSVTVDTEAGAVGSVAVEGSTVEYDPQTTAADNLGENFEEVAKALKIAESASWPAWDHNG